MKTFFSSTFMNQKLLEEANIHYPIRLAYYKIINEEAEKQEKEKFGIQVVKIEYKKEKTKIENKKIKHITNEETKIEEVLKILRKNEVTPIIVDDVLSDFNVKFA